MSDTIFDQIVKKEMPAWVIWEDHSYMAFLTPFPNTPGAAVVIPKTNPGGYIFNIDETVANGMLSASRKVAKLLEKALNVKRVALVIEGTGVPYAHIKLYPLHGKLAEATDIKLNREEFYPEYRGYLSTVEGPRMSDEELNKIQETIIGANK